MAYWSALRNYIKSNYKIAENNLDAIKLLFNVEDGRAQAAWITNRRYRLGADLHGRVHGG